MRINPGGVRKIMSYREAWEKFGRREIHYTAYQPQPADPPTATAGHNTRPTDWQLRLGTRSQDWITATG